jgi:lactoylglutathione lyase
MKINELNHVALQVADVPRTIAFYTNVVGLTTIPRPNFGFPGAWFRIGSVQELHIIQGPPDAANSASRGNHFAMLVNTIEEAQAQLDKHGIKYTGPHHRPDGAKQVFFTDPDGHTVELCTKPG